MNNLQITEYKDIRVLTTQQIAEAYGTDTNVITKNFNRNKDRYTEGKHYVCLEGDELKEFKTKGQIDLSLKVNKLYLWTEKGAFLHAKSLGTDEAWEVYERLVDFYFNKQKPLTIPEQIQILAQGNIELEKKVDSINKDLQDFKKDLPLLAVECEKITKAVCTKGTDVLGGKDSKAYNDRSLRSKVFRDIHNEAKRQFGVTTYKAIKRSQCSIAIGIIEDYQLPYALAEEIRHVNDHIAF
jgi:hypothetical protein